MDIGILKEKIENTIKQQMPANEFTSWYENWFSDEVDEHSVDKIIFVALENLYNDIGYFEPHEEICKEHNSYYGIERLFEKLSQILKEIDSYPQ